MTKTAKTGQSLGEESPTESKQKDEQKEDTATKLLVLAESAQKLGKLDVFEVPSGEVFATFNKIETTPIESHKFKRFLFETYRDEHGVVCGPDAVNTVIAWLKGCPSQRDAVHVRIGHHGDAIYIDRCSGDWKIIKITADGWAEIDANDCPIKFWRPRGMHTLPKPDRDHADLNKLRTILALKDDELTWRKFVIFLTACFSNGAQLLLEIIGEKGSAKSTRAKLLRRSFDPSETDLQSLPDNRRELALCARNQGMVVPDNVESISRDQSDGLCLICSGAGWREREMRSNCDEFLYRFRRPVIVTAIKDVITRPDLASRKLKAVLTKMETTRDELEVYAEFDEAWPAILAGLYNTVSGALKSNRDNPVSREIRLPRMATVAKFVIGVERFLRWDDGTVIKIFNDEAQADAQETVEGDAFGKILFQIVDAADDKKWTGKADDILGQIKARRGGDDPPLWWPTTPRKLGNHMRSNADPYRVAYGLTYEYETSGERNWTFRIEAKPDAASAHESAPAADPSKGQEFEFGTGD